MHDHRSLVAWQVSRQLYLEVFGLAARHGEPVLRPLFGQLQRAALSVPLNICEGYTWRPARRWVGHLRIAYGSAVETRECLAILREIHPPTVQKVDTLVTLATRSEGLVVGLLKRESPSLLTPHRSRRRSRP
ncbi:MAG TPA: four helix bundle protein [Gemmatimonadales bacterium]|nr:four helix bundle protein [Gemmatimonadales bacterium]